MDSMTAPSELIALCGKVRDESISPEEFERLQTMLMADPNSLAFYREFISVCSGLEQIAQADFQQDEHTGIGNDREFDWTDDLEKLTPVSEFVHRSPTKPEQLADDRKSRTPVTAGLIAAIAASIGFALLMMRPDEPPNGYASLVDSYQAVWDESEPTEQLNGKFALLSGAARIRYDNGAELLVQAPASFSIDSFGQASLDRGSLQLYVPPAATGFQIMTPYGRIVDRGTRIGVFVHADLGLEVHVFEGCAEAIRKASKLGHSEQEDISEQESGDKMAGEVLVAGEAISIPVAGNVPAKRMTANPIYFADRDNLLNNLPDVSGNIEMMVSPPRSVRRVRSELSDLGRAVIFPEQKNVVLTEDLLVSIVDPADTQSLERRDRAIPASSRVDSMMVHFAVPMAQRRGADVLVATGKIQFPRPIVGIVCDQPADLAWLLGHPDTDYPLDRGTGLEDSIDDDFQNADRIEWSADRKTLRFSLRIHGREAAEQSDFVDQFRVLIKAAPDR